MGQVMDLGCTLVEIGRGACPLVWSPGLLFFHLPHHLFLDSLPQTQRAQVCLYHLPQAGAGEWGRLFALHTAVP